MGEFVRVGVCLFAAVWVSCLNATIEAQAQIPSFDSDDPQAAFSAMAEYLSRDGGRWRAANPNHDGSRAESPPEFGLWFDWVLEQRTLELRIVLHYSDSSVVSSGGYWVWHPGEEELSYVMIGRNGSLTEGTTDFPNATTFTTVATLYRPGGTASVHRDDNVLVIETVHRNETFRRDEAGVWVSQGVYEWYRTRDDTRR